jgi:hypothetical protein
MFLPAVFGFSDVLVCVRGVVWCLFRSFFQPCSVLVMFWCVLVAWCGVGSDVSSSLVWFLEPNKGGGNIGTNTTR